MKIEKKLEKGFKKRSKKNGSKKKWFPMPCKNQVLRQVQKGGIQSASVVLVYIWMQESCLIFNTLCTYLALRILIVFRTSTSESISIAIVVIKKLK